MLVMGIETSCDETAAAVVDDTRIILSNVVFSQSCEHRPYGGIVPEIAARSHLKHLPGVMRQALDDAGIGFSSLDGIAATAGPGLIGGVMVGLTAAKAAALVHDIPLAAVNHMEAHALTPRLTDEVAYPYLALLISGGHSQFVAISNVGAYRILGTTLDDAIGEAFDKTATLLGLPYPGGPELEQLAREGHADRFSLPRPMCGREGCDFSFSGLKTAVRRIIVERAPSDIGKATFPHQDSADIAASFQQAVVDIVLDRTRNAIAAFRASHPDGTAFVAAGGVAANAALRHALEDLAASSGLAFTAPPPALCTDNAAMVAWAGIERLAAGLVDDLDFAPRPRWPLDGETMIDREAVVDRATAAQS